MSQLSEEELSTAANRLAAGRILAVESHPYLSKSLFAMVPVVKEGLGTFAVDKRWRMYYDPKTCLKWSTQEIAAVWLHEVGHLVRDHARRFDQFSEPHYAQQWNQAADAAINSDLKQENILLPEPDKRFYAEPNMLYPQWNNGMTTEEMYKIAKGAGKGEEQKHGSGSESSEEAEDGSGEEEAAPSSSEDNDENEDAKPESSGPSEGSDSEDQEDSTGDADTSDSSDSEEPQDGEGEGQQGSSGGTNDKDGSEGQEGSSAPSEGQPEDDTGESSHHDCGSGATGGMRDYEDPYDADDGSLDPDEAEIVREETAKDILDASQAGKVPAGLVREAEDIVDPQVDWRTELMSVVRRACATVMGAKDYSYRRPSRRSAMTGFYLPSLRAPRPPEIAIVLDTSGSMTPQDLAVALTEMQSILDRSAPGSGKGLTIINCDAAASTAETIKSIDDIVIVGGGGTDMRVGIKQASELRPKPDVVITITDGGTPWPKEPDARGISYINVIVTPKGKNPWRVATSQPPSWMHTIYVDRKPSSYRY